MGSGHRETTLASLGTEFDRGRDNFWFRKEPTTVDTPPRARDPGFGFVTLFKLNKGENFYDLFRERYPDDTAKRYEVLAQLAMTMRSVLGPSTIAQEKPAKKPTLPAGYTYLGQLIAHDVSFSSDKNAFVDGAPVDNVDRRNLRDVALILQTIYGDGPDAFPLGYTSDAPTQGRDHMDRIRLRLGPLHESDGDVQPSSWHDLPRASCPHLGERFELSPSLANPGRVRAVIRRVVEEARKSEFDEKAIVRLITDEFPRSLPQTEALIADIRNDQHAIISQLTALFHRFHNRVCDLLTTGSPGNDDRSSRTTFDAARSITVHTYRRIILYDFLDRLLDHRIYSHYKPLRTGSRETTFLFPRKYAAIPVEFSHAAFRFGHAMIRDGYRFTSTGTEDDFSIQRVLERSSSQMFEFLPSSRLWDIRWRNFFDGFHDQAGISPQLSREIGPAIGELPHHMGQVLPDDLAHGSGIDAGHLADLAKEAGLPFRDLVRSCSVPMATVGAIIKRMRANPTFADVLATHPLLRSPRERADFIQDWLKSSGAELSETDKIFLSSNPPLLFFILLEAKAVGDGCRLGPVGSFIIAEVLCSTLSTPSSSDRGSRSGFKLRSYKHPRVWSKLYRKVFPQNGKPPRKMHELIEFVEAGGE